MNTMITDAAERERFEEWARSLNYDLHRAGEDGWDLVKGEYTDPDVMGAWVAWQEALAARQPVGEVVAYLTIDDPINGEAGDWDIETNGETLDRLAQSVAAGCRIPLYAAPPQQPERVDRSEFRKLSEEWLAGAEAMGGNTDRKRALWSCAKELRDLIDEQESRP